MCLPIPDSQSARRTYPSQSRPSLGWEEAEEENIRRVFEFRLLGLNKDLRLLPKGCRFNSQVECCHCSSERVPRSRGKRSDAREPGDKSLCFAAQLLFLCRVVMGNVANLHAAQRLSQKSINASFTLAGKEHSTCWKHSASLKPRAYIELSSRKLPEDFHTQLTQLQRLMYCRFVGLMCGAVCV